jgi:hypothetical protein
MIFQQPRDLTSILLKNEQASNTPIVQKKKAENANYNDLLVQQAQKRFARPQTGEKILNLRQS